MFENIPVDVGMIYEGERIRKHAMHADLGGPKAIGVELLRVVPMEKIEKDEVIIKGKDIQEMEEGKAYPFGMFIEVAGEKLEEDLEGIFERKIHYFLNYIQGFMHLNSRDTIWCRVSKEAKKKGLTLKHIAEILITFYKTEFEVIKKVRVTLLTDEEEVKKFIEKARAIYEKRDARSRKLRDEDVDIFYACILCQSFAPQHVCIISPNRISLCGSISWFEGRAAVKIDPHGPIFEVKKGELLDEEKGEYSGVNEAVKKASNGAIERIYMHSMFGYPHTSCGCFEAIAFYIPEVDGIGIVHRNFKGLTPFGLPFSTLASQTGGGIQQEGFLGIAIEYLRSSKFFQGDGGWERIVWLPKELKERVKDAIPQELYDKIATEEIGDIEALKNFLREKQHPVVRRWVEKKEEKEEPAIVAEELELPAIGGGIKIILKNAKIYAETVIIKKTEKK